jgi:hypothetical protein
MSSGFVMYEHVIELVNIRRRDKRQIVLEL